MLFGFIFSLLSLREEGKNVHIEREDALFLVERLLREDRIDHRNRKYVVELIRFYGVRSPIFARAQEKLDELHEEAVKELEFLLENGGINSTNCDHAMRMVKFYGINSHQVFQDVWEQCEVLRREGVISS